MFSEIKSKNKNRFSDPIISNLPICLKIFYIKDCPINSSIKLAFYAIKYNQ